MEVLQASLMGKWMLPLCYMLRQLYDYSVLAWVFRGIGDGFRIFWNDSLFGRFITREGGLSRGWRYSSSCQIISMIVNIPGMILKFIYGALRSVFNSSYAARFCFAVVDSTPIAVGWLIFALMIIPYDHFNNAYSFLGFTLMLVFAIFACMKRKSRRLDTVALGPYVVGFAGFVLLAYPLSAYMHLSARFLPYHLACMFCVLVIVSTVERAYQLRRLCGMATLGLIVMSGYGFLQRIEGVEVNTSYVDILLNMNMPGRVDGMYDNPNAFGEVLVLLIPVAIGLMLASRTWGGRFLGLLGAGMGSVALAITYSRAGYIGLVVSLLIFIFLWNKKLLPAVLLLGAAAIPFLPESVFNRMLTIFNFDDTSTSSRFPLYEAALRFFQARPLRGAGLGSDAVRQGVTDLNLYYSEIPFVHTHNVYFQVWAETGLFGLLALLGSVGHTFKQAAKTVFGQMGSRSTRMMIIGSVSALIGIMVCGIADYIWHYPRVMLIFWFVFALALAGIRLALREEKEIQREIRRLES